MRLDPERVDLIKVDIAVSKQTPVRENTKAEISTQGVTGMTQLEMTTNQNDMAPPKSIANEKYPVLKGSPSKVAEIMDNVATTADSVRKLSDQLRANPSQIIFGTKKSK